jgi:hypothetical protein
MSVDKNGPVGGTTGATHPQPELQLEPTRIHTQPPLPSDWLS